MNYLFYSIIFCSVAGIILIPLVFQYYLKLDFISKIATKKIIQQKPRFFSEYLIKQAVKSAILHRSKQQINLLTQGKLLAFAKEIQKDEPLTLLLKSFFDSSAAAKKLEKQYKSQKNQELAVWLALINEATGNKIKAELFWDSVTDKKLPRYLRPYALSYLAKKALTNGDLEFASRNFYRAASEFHRQKSFYEEAETYLLLGTIYRISFINDVSEMLFLSAQKLCENLKWQEGLAKTYANLGMLMTSQERFDEAQSYFEKAEEIYLSLQQNTEVAEVYNQQALMFLLKKEYKSAQNIIKKAEKIHKNQKNQIGLAFSQDIAANISWQMKDFAKAIKQAASAAEEYRRCTHISGELESLYLQAQALYKTGDDKTTESILRQILEKGKQDCGCFYMANAYNLLGIIYMKRHDLERAKGLFRQSLTLEQRGVRINALAADYTNIGLVEMYSGQKDSARQNLQTALNFAKEIEDKELCACLQKYLNRLNN